MSYLRLVLKGRGFIEVVLERDVLLPNNKAISGGW
jgi:hypothetical protein